MKRPVVIALVAAFVGLPAAASAHPVPFTFVDVRVQAGALEITVVAHVFDLGHDLDVAPPEQLLEPAVLASKAGAITDLVRTRLRLAGNGWELSTGEWSAPEALAERQSIQVRALFRLESAPATVTVSTLMFPYDPAHQTFINFYELDEVMSQAILDRSRTGIEYFAGTRQGVWAVLRRFVPEGIRHMLMSTFYFAVMNIFIKKVSHFPAMEIVFFRCFISMLICIVLVLH